MSDQTNNFWPFSFDNVEHWAYQENVFSEEECDYIIEMGNSLDLKKGKTSSAKQSDDIRKSQVSWVEPNTDIAWIFQRIAGAITDLNSKFFNFELYGLSEGLQFTKYEAPDGHYTKHVDKSLHRQVRKLSITIQLSDENSYDGGDVILHYSSNPSVLKRSRGTLSIFPSYVLHEVTPVTRGTRYSLVCWVTGPSFR